MSRRTESTTRRWRARVAALVVTLASAAGQEGPLADASPARRFDDELGEIHRMMDDGRWVTARDELAALLARHEGADYVVARAPGLALDLDRAHYWSEHDVAAPRVSGELLRHNVTRNLVKVRYTPQTLDDFERQPPPDGWTSLRVHPLDFSGPYRVELSARSDVHWQPPVVLVGLSDDEAWVVSRRYVGTFGEGRRERAWRRVDRVLHLHRGEAEVVDERVRELARVDDVYAVDVDVSSTWMVVRMSGGTSLRAPKPRRHFGRVALGVPTSSRRDAGPPFETLVLEGEGAAGWLGALVDDARCASRTASEHEAFARMPDWLAEAAVGPLGPDDHDEGPADSLADAIRVAHVDRHWRRGEYDAGLRYLEQLGVGRAGLPEPWRLLEMARFALAAGRPMEARRRCLDALELRPDDVEARALFARLYAHLGQPHRALDELAALAAEQPGAAAPYEQLVAAHLHAGRPDAAREALADAARADVTSPRLLHEAHRLALAARGPDWPRTYLVESRHYRVASDLDARVCARAAAVLEDTHRFVCDDLGLRPPDGAPFDVLLFGGDRGYQRYVSRAIGRLPHRTAGVYDHGLRQLVIWNRPNEDAMLATVRHEGFHQILHAVVGDAPRWFDEGLAECYEHGKAVHGRWRLDGDVPDAHRDALSGALTPLDTFIHDEPAAFLADAARHYAQAWAVVTFLREREPARFTRLLDALTAGESARVALRKAFDGVDWDAFDRAFRADVAARLARG